MTQSQARRSVPAVVLLASIWIITHPFEGLRHDAVLYAAQILSRAGSQALAQDLFFRWGSQDDFTVFGRLGGALARALGLSATAVILFALGQAAWFAVALGWSRNVIAGRWWPVGAALVFSVPHLYSVDGLIGSAEPFLTARLIAEPLALAGLLAWTTRRHVLAVALLCAACLFHPLMALPVLGVVVIVGLVGRFGWPPVVIAVGSGLLLLTLALAGAGPIGHIDDPWYRLLRVRALYSWPQEWVAADLARWLAQGLLLLAASRWPGANRTNLWRAVALTGLLGVVLTVLGALARSSLIVQAQPWRAMWLVEWCACLAVAGLAFGPGAPSRANRLVALAGVPVVAMMHFWWDPGAGWIALGYACALLGLTFARPLADERLTRALLVAILAGLALMALWLGGFEIFAIRTRAAQGFALDQTELARVVSALGWVALTALAAVFVVLSGTAGPARAASVALAALAAAASVWFADGRASGVAALETLARQGMQQWQRVIPLTSTVYWPGHLREVWFVLGRASYISQEQLSGARYSRAAAIEGERRMRNVAELGGRDAVFDLHALPDVDAARPRVGRAELGRACADPELGFVVLAALPPAPGALVASAPVPAVADPIVSEDVGPDHVDPATGHRYRLHDCASFRAPKPG